MIASAPLLGWILAQTPEEKLRALRQGFVDQSAGGSTLLVLTIFGICVIAVGLVVLRQHRKKVAELQRRHVDVFSLALESLKFPDGEATLLRSIARRANLREPTAMLLSPANLNFALDSAGDFGADASVRQRADAICFDLFGIGLQKTTPPRE